MGWKTWLVLLVLVILVCWWLWRKLFGIRGTQLPFIGLSPLTGDLRSMRKYIGGLGGFLLDVEEDEIKIGTKDTTLSTLHIPRSWNFTTITGAKKRERIVRHILETLFQDEFPTIRPDWLRNPLTNRTLEIDCYNEKLGLAVEVSGAQHYQFEDNGFHHTREEFVKQVYRDRVKKEIILQRGLNFIVVPYTVRQDQLPQYIITCLQELGYSVD